MLVYYEVRKFRLVDELPIDEELAAVDVAILSDNEKMSLLENLKAYYGDECTYWEHDCGHDEVSFGQCIITPL